MADLNLLPMTNSNLYVRRTSSVRSQAATVPSLFCSYCLGKFEPEEAFVHTETLNFHQHCFNCAQCFEPLPTDNFYNVEGRVYCEYDFARNYAPICQACKKCVFGKVIKTQKGHYHVQCLKCDDCGDLIEDSLHFEMTKNLCQKCYKPSKKPDICVKCKIPVLEEERLWYLNDCWHAHHFECTRCGTELTNTAKNWRDRLYCQTCYDRYILLICAHCHKVIDYQDERAITVNGKHYHPGHFLCAKCGVELRFGHKELRGRNYCNGCYLEEAGDKCVICEKAEPDMIKALNKFYCYQCFRCAHCQKKLFVKSEIINFDLQPICKGCYKKLPKDLRKQLKKSAEAARSPKSP